jgi:hypothetical protein
MQLPIQVVVVVARNMDLLVIRQAMVDQVL